MARNNQRGASRRTAASKRPLPGWLWLVTGLAAGLFIAFLFHLAQLQRQTTAAAKVAKTVPAKNDNPSGKPLPKFDFYAVLPKREVILPRDDDDTTGKPTTPAATSATTAPTTAAPATNAQKTPTTAKPTTASAGASQGRFLLQAGSFHDSADAERLRAEYTLDGFNVHVQPGTLDNGDTWYRVMIGPFSSKEELRNAQTRLAARHVDALPIQVKGN